jgi:hypothetical protein
LDLIVGYIVALEGGSDEHADGIELTAAVEMHLQQALAAITANQVSEAIHHVLYAQNKAGPSSAAMLAGLVDLLNGGNLHNTGHEIEEFLGEEVHAD